MARRKKTRTLPGDRIASGVILASLIGIALLVYLSGRSDRASMATEADSPWVAGMDPVPAATGALGLSGTRIYTPENLYEYIDGQAPHYIGFGFRALLVAEYSSGSQSIPSLVVDFYDMVRRRNAYGLFMDTVPPEDEIVALGNAGYASGSVASFWRGPFFVRVSALTGGDMSREVEAAARSVAEKIRDDSTTLAEFGAFPTDGLLPDTLSYSKSAAFGLPYLRDTFFASYEQTESYYRLFFCEVASPGQAAQILSDHAAFLKSNDGLLIEDYVSDPKTVWGKDRYVGPTLMVARDRFVAGSTGIEELDTAAPVVLRLLEQVIQTVPKLNEEVPQNGEE